MGSMGNPKAWVPYVNSKDCSQGFCSLYCPQWCYIMFPPPPPFEFHEDSSGPNFSPLVIAIMGILASAFLLVSYYSIISKYCGNTNSSRRRENDDDPVEESVGDNQNPSDLHEPWHAAATTGLDEALIKSITMCKFKKGDGLTEGTDCSVCLSEFEEDESLRLLPKCSHAFHVQCIDTWLKSHSNCPLCRANIFFISASPPQLPPPAMAETPPNHGALQGHSQGPGENTAAATQDHRERNVGEDAETPVRAFSDLGNLHGRDIVIEIIRDEGYQEMRRSFSMDHTCQRSRVSIAQVLRMNPDDDERIEEEKDRNHAGSSKESSADQFGNSSHRKKVVSVVMNPLAMKRSLSRQGRSVRDAIIPL